MTQLVLPLNKQAIERADKEFYGRHPERAGKPLTANPEDAKYRMEWLQLYKQFGGKLRERTRPVKDKTSRQAVCVDRGDEKHRKIYVYLYQSNYPPALPGDSYSSNLRARFKTSDSILEVSLSIEPIARSGLL